MQRQGVSRRSSPRSRASLLLVAVVVFFFFVARSATPCRYREMPVNSRGGGRIPVAGFPADGDMYGVGASKRMVPQGPNPLHN
ncbi:unnamed protein product [Spirodela intermedia]|uniref:Uncharacterized protein n=1 Tax=Spirodela intermedia TaxID=51605 RepID=A0A7I8IE31_SPIIN|nr:unnamed protein product [Spirodela intermedia]CAA6655644.1 unnamed protein product [Spirodela intermedia]